MENGLPVLEPSQDASEELRLNRGRLFALLDSFEQDMRALVEQYILSHLSEEAGVGVDFEKASALRSSDAEDDYVPIVHYLYLRQCYDVLNRNRQHLPGELAEELRANTPRLDELVGIRNRVMHGRPLRGNDPENCISVLTSYTTRFWRQTRETIERLRSDVTWEPAFETMPLASERVLHNLPLADYDETGLVGRADDVMNLKRLIQRKRETVITVTGEGGIGKTALALEVAYAIVDDPATTFDCVLWVTLKSEVLTTSGVRSIERAIQDVSGAADHLGAALDQSFSGRVESLAEALGGISALIVIDNLESAQGDEILRLYDSLPDTVSYLFTSRIGLGQLERRIALGPLSERDGLALFKKLSSSRAPQLARLSPTATAQVLTRLRYSPLAIRWYILSVEAGQEPTSTLRDQKELIEFCIRNVYEAVSSRARAILDTVDAVDRSLSFDELAILSDMTIDDLRAASQELGRGALIVHEPDPEGGLVSKLALSTAARMFLKTQPGREGSLQRIHLLEEDFRKNAERRRTEVSARALGPNVVRARTAEDEPVVHLLYIALSHSRRGDIEQAMQFIDRARALNPEYWEVDRVAAFIASTQRRGHEATSLYRNALSAATTREEKAVVQYFLAGHLARGMQDLDGALPYAEEAHAVFDSPDTALQLGNLKVWTQDFEEGQVLLEHAMEVARGKTYLIAATAMVESWRRWAESASNDRNLSEAIDRAYAGFSIGVQVSAEGIVDSRLAGETVDCAFECFRNMQKTGASADVRRIEIMATWLRANYDLASSTRGWQRVERAAFAHGEVLEVSQQNAGTKEEMPEASTALQSIGYGDTSMLRNRHVGRVISWAGRYGFIEHARYPNNVFFHSGSVKSGMSGDMRRGIMVQFDVDESEAGRVRALNVCPISLVK